MEPIIIVMIVLASVLAAIVLVMILYCLCCSPNQNPRRAHNVIPFRYSMVSGQGQGPVEHEV